MYLDKWYFDAVLDDGTVWYGYRARLYVFGIRLCWCAGTAVERSGARREVSRWRDLPEPGFAEGTWGWTSPDGLDNTWQPVTPRREFVLASDKRLSIRWECLASHAVVCSKGLGGTRRGVGYVERLRVKSTRAALPFRKLWWGHAYAGDSSLVWIRWAQGRDLSLLVEDGTRVDGRFECGTDGTLRIESPRGRWEMGVGRTLCDRNPRNDFSKWLVWASGGLAPVRELKQTGRVTLASAFAGKIIDGAGVWEDVAWA